MKSTYQKALDNHLAEIRQVTESINNLNEQKEKLDALDNLLLGYAHLQPDLCDNGYLRVSVNELKDVVPLLKALRELGYKSTHITDAPEYHQRTYHCGLLWVCATLKKDAACQRVQVGEEIIKRPVYKIMCPEKMELPAITEEERGI